MSKTVSKFAFTVGIMLAMAFTFSCDSGGGGDGTGGGSSSSGGPGPGGGGNSSSGGGGGGGNSNCTADFGIVAIGSQVWAKKNLNCDVGVSKCYDDDPANCTKYGRLYDWNTAKTACPKGWHLPSDAEWDALMTAVGGSSTAGGKLKATSGWNGNGNGTDEYGFSALPGGDGDSDGIFDPVGRSGLWWSATEVISDLVYSRSMSYNSSSVYRLGRSKSSLLSVRCVQD